VGRDLAGRREDTGVLISPATRDLDEARSDLRQRLGFEQGQAERGQIEVGTLRRHAAAAGLDAILADG
jgi:hypothetical protein